MNQNKLSIHPAVQDFRRLGYARAGSPVPQSGQPPVKSFDGVREGLEVRYV